MVLTGVRTVGLHGLRWSDFDLEKNDYKSFFQREFAVSRKREPLGKNTALPYWRTEDECMEDYKKNDGCKTAFVIFGMPDKNKTNRGLTGIEPITNP